MNELKGNGADVTHRIALIAQSICAIVTVYILITCFYNLFLHPLRCLPGPPLARISKLWSRIGNFYGIKSHRIHEAHLKYGPVVRVGPNEVSFADPRAVRDIYTSDLFVKEESFYRSKRIFHENHMMSFRDPQAHKQRRKLLSRGYSQAAMLDFEHNMSTKIQDLLDQWARRCKDGPIDVYPWAHWVAFDIVYHLLFDEDPGSVKASSAPKLMPYIRAWRPTFIYKELVPQLEQWGPYVPGPVGDNFRKVRDWKDMAVEIIRDCRQRNTTTPFLRSVLQGDKDAFLGRELTDSELAEECMGGIESGRHGTGMMPGIIAITFPQILVLLSVDDIHRFGGSGTTANTFVYLCWACFGKPDVKQKLKSELIKAFPTNIDVPDYSTCVTLPYLQAVISETLRLYPTIIATLPRTAKRSSVVAGISVPKGTIVGTQNLTIHRNERAFPDPEEFLPERWLQKENEEAQKEAWTPFSVGTRKCVGINLAQMELSKLVAAFFLRFEAEIDTTMTPQDMRMYDAFSASPAGGKLLLQLKESVAAGDEDKKLVR